MFVEPATPLIHQAEPPMHPLFSELKGSSFAGVPSPLSPTLRHTSHLTSSGTQEIEHGTNASLYTQHFPAQYMTQSTNAPFRRPLGPRSLSVTSVPSAQAEFGAHPSSVVSLLAAPTQHVTRDGYNHNMNGVSSESWTWVDPGGDYAALQPSSAPVPESGLGFHHTTENKMYRDMSLTGNNHTNRPGSYGEAHHQPEDVNLGMFNIDVLNSLPPYDMHAHIPDKDHIYDYNDGAALGLSANLTQEPAASEYSAELKPNDMSNIYPDRTLTPPSSKGGDYPTGGHQYGDSSTTKATADLAGQGTNTIADVRVQLPPHIFLPDKLNHAYLGFFAMSSRVPLALHNLWYNLMFTWINIELINNFPSSPVSFPSIIQFCVCH
jgi:hypothetical protein